MKKSNTKIKKDELRKIKRGARRNVDVAEGIGVNRKAQVFVDKKKKTSKNKCREKGKEDG